jgi:hypothetical protein
MIMIMIIITGYLIRMVEEYNRVSVKTDSRPAQIRTEDLMTTMQIGSHDSVPCSTAQV